MCSLPLNRRDNIWWYKFRFEGQAIRDSAKTNSKALEREAERARRRDLETAVNRIQRRECMPLFKMAAGYPPGPRSLTKAVSVLTTMWPFLPRSLAAVSCATLISKTSRHFNANGLPKVGRGGQ